MAENYVKVEVTFKHKSDMAVLVSWEEGQEWIPRSCLSYRCDKKLDTLLRNEDFQLEVAEWKALELGLEY